MELSPDPYELKLYQMFKSCDKEECGLLDEDALRRLCGLLELQDKGTVLIADLIGNGRVSFDRFKEALLNFLGAELELDTKEKNSQSDAHILSDNVISAATFTNASNSTNTICFVDRKGKLISKINTKTEQVPIEQIICLTSEHNPREDIQNELKQCSWSPPS